MARPGVMLYFSVLPALDSLPPASAGTLLLAAMHYAQDGQEPIFEDSTLSFSWAFLKPSIDRDGETYSEKRQRGEWLTYCRQCKRDGIDSMDFETWRQRDVTEPLHADTNTAPISMSIINTSTISVPMSMSNKGIEADASCAEPETVSTPPIISLPLNDGTEYPVYQEQCHEWAALYPAVDVMQQLRSMKGWLDANPTKRKTKRGVKTFINGWLSREQDKGGSHARGQGKRPVAEPGNNSWMNWMKKYIDQRRRGDGG